MKRVFDFGKIDFYGTGRQVNAVTVEMRLDDENVFSACGYVWNAWRTDICMGGQGLDDLLKYPKIAKNPLYQEIHRLWKAYHLNNMHAGTPEQEKAINSWVAAGNKYDYTGACEYLKSIGLYEVNLNGSPYKYGHGWLKEEIPEKDLEIIKALIQKGELSRDFPEKSERDKSSDEEIER